MGQLTSLSKKVASPMHAELTNEWVGQTWASQIRPKFAQMKIGYNPTGEIKIGYNPTLPTLQNLSSFFFSF